MLGVFGGGRLGRLVRVHDQILRHALTNGVDGEQIVFCCLGCLACLPGQGPLLLRLRRHYIVKIITTKAKPECIVGNIFGRENSCLPWHWPERSRALPRRIRLTLPVVLATRILLHLDL